MNAEAKLRYCQGCRDDFYNGHNEIGVKRCWMLENAKVVTRYKIGWWIPTVRRNFIKVRTLDCHYEPGRAAFRESLPEK